MDKTPSTSVMTASVAQRRAEARVDAQRRLERKAVRVRALKIGGLLLVAALVAGVVMLLIRSRGPWVIAPIAAPPATPAAAQVGQLDFIATTDDGHTALWRYRSPIRASAALIVGKAGNRHVDVVTEADAAALTGPPPTLLPFQQTGQTVHFDVDGAARQLQFRTFNEPCAKDPSLQSRQWSLCEVPDAAGAFSCVEAPELVDYCLTQEPRLVSLHRSGDVLWVIAERPMPLTPRMAAGAVMTSLFAQP